MFLLLTELSRQTAGSSPLPAQKSKLEKERVTILQTRHIILQKKAHSVAGTEYHI
jgi:hypothetical protein